MARREAGAAPTEARRRLLPLSPPEVDLLLAIEGRSPEVVVATAQRLGLGPEAVWRWINRLRKRGLVSTVTLIDRTRFRASVETVARIRLDWSHPSVADLEAVLRDDPAVTQAALTLGPFDYTAFAIHDDHHAAAAWSRRLQSQPAVYWCKVDRVQTRFKRFSFVAALLSRCRHFVNI